MTALLECKDFGIGKETPVAQSIIVKRFVSVIISEMCIRIAPGIEINDDVVAFVNRRSSRYVVGDYRRTGECKIRSTIVWSPEKRIDRT
jgi:hypothetical protein